MLILITLLSFFLHQSIRTGMGNISISDFILINIYVYLLINHLIYVKKSYLLVMIFLLIFIIIISLYYTPIIFEISVSEKNFISELIKLLALLTFFFMGIELVELKLIDTLLIGYSYSGFLIAVIGVAMSLFNIPIYDEILFKYSFRLNGLMNDPNYFAILQITTLPYFIKKNYKSFLKKIIIISVIIFSIILSGSKTGLLTLGIYFLIIFLERNIILREKIAKKEVVKNLFLLTVYLCCFIFVVVNLTILLEWLNLHFPSTKRLTILFTYLDTAVSSGGSSRDVAWKVGTEIVKKSPIVGVGIGNYLTIGDRYFGTRVIAHNTYIQLSAEWGLPLTLIFWGRISILIVSIIRKKNKVHYLYVLRDILIIFLIGSIGISLNNARFFWLALGAASTLYNSN